MLTPAAEGVLVHQSSLLQNNTVVVQGWASPLSQAVAVLIPGHGSVGGADQVRARIDLDRAYVEALRDKMGDVASGTVAGRSSATGSA